MQIKSVNPKNGKLLAQFDPASDRAIESALAAAENAFRSHRRTRFEERAQKLRVLADRLDSDSERWGRLLSDEMGKTLGSATDEVEKCARVCRYYADNAESLLADVPLPEAGHRNAAIVHLPLGPVLAVMPWNFPFWQVFRFAAPAVMAGNAVLLKHASNVPQAALALQSLFEGAGFEPGLFQALLIRPERVDPIVADRRVVAATVTGSVRAGSAVAAAAGKHSKKTVLELGGSDPFIVMPSADLEKALETAVTARMLNNGQSCIAAKRFIVHEDVYQAFARGFVERVEALEVGDPLDDGSDIGPLAMDRVRDRLQRQVEELMSRGAARLTGARPIDGPGYFFQPGILEGIDGSAPPFDEELFGPVAWLLKAGSLEEAIERANETQYGLGSALWTSDEREMERASREIDAGATFINSLVESDPRFPFGGVKKSGHGRELARDGILEFVNRKTVVVD